MYSAHYTMYNSLYTMYNSHYTMYNSHTPQCTVHTLDCHFAGLQGEAIGDVRFNSEGDAVTIFII